MSLDKLKKIVAIGDSIIEGKAAPELKGWVYLFSEHLIDIGSDHTLINNGEGGNTSEDVRRYLREDCLIHQPDLVIFGVGVNDSRYRPSKKSNDVEIIRFEQNVKYIFEQIRLQTKAQIMVIGQIPVIDELVDPYKSDKHYRRSLQIPYNHVLQAEAKSLHGVFVDIFQEWITRGEDFIRIHLSDGLHPNLKGHQEIEKSVFGSYSRI